MNNIITRRSLFSLIASVPAVMLVVPETKIYTINHSAFLYLQECADKNVGAGFDKFLSLFSKDSKKNIADCHPKELPKKFWWNYKLYIDENFPVNFKEIMSYRERYHHLLNTVQNQWNPEGYSEHINNTALLV